MFQSPSSPLRRAWSPSSWSSSSSAASDSPSTRGDSTGRTTSSPTRSGWWRTTTTTMTVITPWSEEQKTRDMEFNWSCMPSVLDMMLADVTWIRKSVVCSLPVDEKVCNSFYPSKRGRKREYIHWNCKDNLFQLLCRNSWEIALALVYQSWLRTALYADNQLLICDLGNMSAFPISLIFVRRCFKLWAVIHSS